MFAGSLAGLLDANHSIKARLLQGKVVVSLQDLKQQGTINSRSTLKGGKSTDGRLEFEMKWSSYLGIHSAEKQSDQQQ